MNCEVDIDYLDLFREEFRKGIMELDSETRAKVIKNSDNQLSSICLDCEKRDSCGTLRVMKEVMKDVGALI